MIKTTKLVAIKKEDILFLNSFTIFISNNRTILDYQAIENFYFFYIKYDFYKQQTLLNSCVLKNIKYGVVGVGHLGLFHIQQIKKVAGVDFVGFYDLDEQRASFVVKQEKVSFFKNIKSLFDLCDAVSIVTPTETHFDLSLLAIKNNCHIF